MIRTNDDKFRSYGPYRYFFFVWRWESSEQNYFAVQTMSTADLWPPNDCSLIDTGGEMLPVKCPFLPGSALVALSRLFVGRAATPIGIGTRPRGSVHRVTEEL